VDFKTDPENCGRCGHGCLDEACAASMCRSVPVSASNGAPNFLTVSRGNVYWTQALHAGDAVLVAPSVGGNPVIFAALPDTAYGVAADTKRLYWIESDDGVFACPRGGCDGGPAFLIGNYFYSEGFGSLTGFEVTPSWIYVTYQNGFVMECPIDTSDNSGCKLVAQSQYLPASPKADDAGLIWANQGSAYKGGSILSCPPSGPCPFPTPLEQDAGAEVQYLAIDPTHVYWTELTSASEAGVSLGAALHCQRSNCTLTAETYAKDQADPQGIVTDDKNVYWANMAEPAILSCPIDGCGSGGPVVLAEGEAGTGGAPFQLALDDAAVYWSNNVQGGLIMRVAKP
jgi:hypothetical protein